MSSTVRLSAHSEELLNEQLLRGSFRTPEEVIERALGALAESPVSGGLPPQHAQNRPVPGAPESRGKSPREAAEHILEIQQRNRLGGLRIKDLINEGRKH
jgi:hypothetical protein